MKKLLKRQEGFTLVEIIIVLVIIAALFAIAIPIYASYVAQARSAEAQEAINTIWSALKIHNAETNTWASNIQQLKRLEMDQVTRRRWNFSWTTSGRGVSSITATSTGLMPGGAGKQVTLNIETGEWRGYGFDTK